MNTVNETVALEGIENHADKFPSWVRGEKFFGFKISEIYYQQNGDALLIPVGSGIPAVTAPLAWLERFRPRVGRFIVFNSVGVEVISEGHFLDNFILLPDVDDGMSVIIEKKAQPGLSHEFSEIDLSAADFSDALMWLKEGKRVQRAGWNGKNQFVEVCKFNNNAFVSDSNQDISYPMVDVLGLKNAQDQFVPGWVPSVGDLMATDWRIVE